MLRPASALRAFVILISVVGVSSAGDDCAEFFLPECDSMPGSRMKCHSGKMWPLAPRPCAPSEPLIHRFHTAHYWPDPYRWQDRNSVRTYIDAQRNSGWMTATTLYEQHFNPETNELNDAGRMHLKWILLYAPASRRTTWVQTGDSPAISQARLAAAQRESAALTGNGACPVMLRVCVPYSTPAQEVDLVRRSYLTSIPVPRIPITFSGGTNTGGSGDSGTDPTQAK